MSDANSKDYQVRYEVDPVSGKVSTIHRIIQLDGHPILTKEMFLKAARARISAARALKVNSVNTETNEIETHLDAFFTDEAAEKKFQMARDNYIRDKKAAEFVKVLNSNDEKRVQKELQLAEQKFNAAFDEFYNLNMSKLKKVNRLLVDYVSPESKKPKEIAKVMKQINAKADELRAQELRPIQHNHYVAVGLEVTSSHIPEGELTANQKELYRETFNREPPTKEVYTSPSTIRDKRQVCQANAIRTEVRVGGKTVFTGHRHGSPSVLKIANEAERQYRTLENVKQTMALAAREKIEKLTNEKTELDSLPQPLSGAHKDRWTEITNILAGKVPLTIDMASMSLLSPVADDNPLLKEKWDDPMKQYRQVNDSRMAYWSLHGREIDLDLLGAMPIKVKLNSTFMNVGVNAARGIGTLEAQALVQRVNNRGFNHLTDGFVNGLKSYENDSHNVKLCKNEIKKIEQEDEKINKYKEKIKKYDFTKLHDAYKGLEESNANLHNAHSKIKMLETELSEVKTAKMTDTEDGHKKIVKSLETDIAIFKEVIKIETSQRKKHLKVIDKEEKKLDLYYKNLAIVRKKAYQKALPGLKKKLEEEQAFYKNNPDALKQNKNFQKIRLFVDTLDTFYNQPQPGLKRLIKQKWLTRKKNKLLKAMPKEKKADKKQAFSEQAEAVQLEIDALNKGNYQFQARFALLTQHMDNFVEWFCKSGEDRTGLLNEQIEAYCLFIEKKGYPPRWGNKEDDAFFYKLMPVVHNGTSNRETNAFNDDGPGLKVTDDDFEMPGLKYYADKRKADIVSKSSKNFDGMASVVDLKKEMGISHGSASAHMPAATSASDLSVNPPAVTSGFQASRSRSGSLSSTSKSPTQKILDIFRKNPGRKP